jgi:hypothetical protein
LAGCLASVFGGKSFTALVSRLLIKP